MNSRQQLPSNKTSSTGFIYKPGFVDKGSLETLKMAIDKELSLISNSFYITEESWKSKYSDLEVDYYKTKALVEELILLVATLTNSLSTAENEIEDLKTRVEVLENKP